MTIAPTKRATGRHAKTATPAVTEKQEQDQEQSKDQQVALLAYQIWLEDGCRHGSHLEHWLLAQQRLAQKLPESKKIK